MPYLRAAKRFQHRRYLLGSRNYVAQGVRHDIRSRLVYREGTKYARSTGSLADSHASQSDLVVL